MSHIWKIVFVTLICRPQEQVICQPPIKIRTSADSYMWKNVELFMNAKYMYQQKALSTPITCHEYAYCQSSIMQTREKEKLLQILNNVRNTFASTRENKTFILQLVWLWKAEIYSIPDSFACAPGSTKYVFLKNEDVNETKPNRTQPVYIQPHFRSTGILITCDPLRMIFETNEPNIEKFLIDFENKLIKSEIYYNLLADRYDHSLFTGCSLMFTKSRTNENTTNVYLNCYLCSPNDYDVFTQISFCPDGFERSSKFPNLCKDLHMTDSFVNEDICLQYNCLALNFSHGCPISGKISLIFLCYLCTSMRLFLA